MMMISVIHPPSFLPSPARARHLLCDVVRRFRSASKIKPALLSIAPPPSPPGNCFLPRCPVSQENAGTSVRRPPRIDCGLLHVGIVVLEMTDEENCICHGISINN